MYDADWPQKTPWYSIDLMKLSTYYKRKGEIVKLSPLFVPEKYSKFLYVRNTNDQAIPSELYRSQNIEYFGDTFHPNKTIVLPKEIEIMPADPTIYNGFSTLKNTKTEEEFLTRNNCGCHVRLSMDGETVYPEWRNQAAQKKAGSLFLYDKNIGNIEGYHDAVAELYDKFSCGKRKVSIVSRYPIQINSIEDYLKWENSYQMYKGNYYHHCGPFPNDILDFLARPPSKYKNTIYCVVPSWSMTNHFFNDDICKIFRQLIFLRSFGQSFLLKYGDENSKDVGWGKVFNFFNYYFFGSAKNYGTKSWHIGHTLYEYAKYKVSDKYYTTSRDIEELREVFAFVRENNYELFKLFYECSEVNLIGGELI